MSNKLREEDFDDFIFYYLYYGRALVRTGKKESIPDNPGLHILTQERARREARTPELDLIVRRNWINSRISSTIIKYHDVNKLMGAGCDHPIREHSVFGIRPKIVEVFRNGEVFEFHAIDQAVAGDDRVVTSTSFIISLMSKNSGRFHAGIGFPRKDLPYDVPSPILSKVTEMSFCSHTPVPVISYNDSNNTWIWKMVMTRPVSQVIGKLLYRTSPSNILSNREWIDADGINTLAMYSHMHLTRTVGLMFKSLNTRGLHIFNPDVFYHRPWIRSGPVLDILNESRWGDTTLFPADFYCSSLSHFGFMDRSMEVQCFDPERDTPARGKWNRAVVDTVQAAVAYHGMTDVDHNMIREMLYKPHH